MEQLVLFRQISYFGRYSVKRTMLTFLIALTLIIIPTWSVGQETIVVIDGKGYNFDPNPVNVEGRKLVPMRSLFEALGANIHWEKETKTVICYIEDYEVQLPVEGTNALVDGEEITLDIPLQLIDGTTYVPLRFIGETLGYCVEWDNSTRTILISKGDNEAEMDFLYSLNGIASWYGGQFHGRRTSSGEVFNQNEFTAAHRSLPFGTFVKVTFVKTGKTTMVRINDRGPHKQERIIDLSRAAAEAIGLRPHGLGEVKIEVLATHY